MQRASAQLVEVPLQVQSPQAREVGKSRPTSSKECFLPPVVHVGRPLCIKEKVDKTYNVNMADRMVKSEVASEERQKKKA